MATSHWLNRIGLAPLFALMSGIGAAALVAAMLPGTFAAFAHATGLGDAGRPLAMLAAFVAVALPVGLATAVVERALAPPATRAAATVAAGEDDDMLDLEPFAEPAPAAAKRPIFADRELGAPLMSDEALLSVARPPVVVEVTATENVMVEPPVAAPMPEVVDERVVSEVLAEPLAVQEFDLIAPDEADEPHPGESSIEALIRRLESGLAHRGPPAPGSVSPQFAAVLRSEINRAAPVAAGRTGKPDDATARALQTLRQMAAG